MPHSERDCDLPNSGARHAVRRFHMPTDYREPSDKFGLQLAIPAGSA